VAPPSGTVGWGRGRATGAVGPSAAGLDGRVVPSVAIGAP
jgi:hypothetical protein